MNTRGVLTWLARGCLAAAGLSAIVLAWALMAAGPTIHTSSNPETVHVTASFTTRINGWIYETPEEFGKGNEAADAEVGDRFEIYLKTDQPADSFRTDLTASIRHEDGQPNDVLVADEGPMTPSKDVLEPNQLQLWGFWVERPGVATIEIRNGAGDVTGTLRVTVGPRTWDLPDQPK